MPTAIDIELGEARYDLVAQLNRAVSAQASGRDPSAFRVATDSFLISASRHLAAVYDVLLPEVVRRDAAPRPVLNAYLRMCRELEFSLMAATTKRLGQAQSTGISWPSLWDEIRKGLERTCAVEEAMVRELCRDLESERACELCDLLLERMRLAPTRVHPRLPQTGLRGRMSRRVWSRVDRVLDELGGRIAPAVTRRAA